MSLIFRVRQFIEMVNGTDSEVRCLGGRSPKSQDSYPGSPRSFSSPGHKAGSSQSYLTGTVPRLAMSPHPAAALIPAAGLFAGVDSNCCNGVASSKSHSSSPHSHKPCPPGSGSTLPVTDVSLNGSRSQLPITRYSLSLGLRLDVCTC